MYIRFKNKNSSEVNVMVSAIASFSPTETGGTKIVLVNGFDYTVEDSTRAVRGAIKRAIAYNPFADETALAETPEA